MKPLAIVYAARLTLEFSREEVATLTVCAKNHYDADCISAALLGGIVYGMKNAIEFRWGVAANSSHTAEVTLSFDDLDLLTKITEAKVTTKRLQESAAILQTRLKEAMALLNEHRVPAKSLQP